MRLDYVAEPLFQASRPVRSQLLQLATGAGKTPIVAEIVHSSQALAARHDRTVRVWFVVPRNELGGQASEHFARWGIKHSMLMAGMEESRAFAVHIVSKDTLLRRLERIKNWPDILIFDEAHIAYDAQLKIIAMCPESTRIIGVTATPERLDGKGLWSGSGGPYDEIIYGPSIPWLTDHNFLSPLRYYAPPLAGLESVKRIGTEYDAAGLEELFERKKVYGDVVGYYEKYGSVKHTSISSPDGLVRTNQNYAKGKPALIFCRSIKSAYDMAERFCSAGFKFFCIEGTMADGRRKELINALRDGTIDGLTNVDIATYGLDVPRVEYGASIRPTLSRALYFQKAGRILRVFPGKTEALFFDHANLVEEHQDLDFPGTPLFYLDKLDWNFEGREKRKRLKDQQIPLRLCPYKGFEYCRDPRCGKSGCVLRDPGDTARADLETVEVKLEERKAPAKLAEYPDEEKREIQDQIGRFTDEAVTGLEAGQILPGPIGELLKLADKIGRKSTWVYWFLTEAMDKKTGKPSRAVNVPLLHEIRRQKNYAQGWVFFMRKQIEKGIKETVNV